MTEQTDQGGGDRRKWLGDWLIEQQQRQGKIKLRRMTKARMGVAMFDSGLKDRLYIETAMADVL